MKKFINPVPAGGAPLHAQELVADVLTKETWTAIEAILGSATPSAYNAIWPNDNLLLSGGVVSPNASNYDVTAGVAYFKTAGGIIAEFPAVTNLPADGGGLLHIELQAPLVETETYFDTTTQDYTTTYNAVIKTTSASADRVVGLASGGSPNPFPSLQAMIDLAVPPFTSSVTPITNWNMNVSDTGTFTFPVVISSATVTTDNFRGAEVMIVDDTGFIWGKLGIGDASAPVNDNSGFEVVFSGSTITVTMALASGSKFDDAAYANDVGARGYITVTYAT